MKFSTPIVLCQISTPIFFGQPHLKLLDETIYCIGKHFFDGSSSLGWLQVRAEIEVVNHNILRKNGDLGSLGRLPDEA